MMASKLLNIRHALGELGIPNVVIRWSDQAWCA